MITSNAKSSFARRVASVLALCLSVIGVAGCAGMMAESHPDRGDAVELVSTAIKVNGVVRDPSQGAQVLLNMPSDASWTRPKTVEIRKIRSIAILTDATMHDWIRENSTEFDVESNIEIARAVADGAKTLLTQKGFIVSAEEYSISLGAILALNKDVLARAGKGSALIRLLLPIHVEPAGFNEKFPKLTALFRQVNIPACEEELPPPAIANIQQVKELDLQSDAVLLIKMAGMLRCPDGLSGVRDAFSSLSPGMNLLFRMGKAQSSGSMELFLLDTKTGDVLWWGSVLKMNPTADDFIGFMMNSFRKLPSV